MATVVGNGDTARDCAVFDCVALSASEFGRFPVPLTLSTNGENTTPPRMTTRSSLALIR